MGVHFDKRPIVLVILDGFGYSADKAYNAIAQATTPTINSWYQNYPFTFLDASGPAVGLPAGKVGNSEVGHMTIGTGRIIEQPLTILDVMCTEGTLFEVEALKKCMVESRTSNATLHLIGLLSDAGIHSDVHHLYALITMAAQLHVRNLAVHVILDGRDVPPRSAHRYLQQLEEKLEQTGIGVIATMQGRWYAMDRDNHWDRSEQAAAILLSDQMQGVPWRQILANSYSQHISDEFIMPTVVTAGYPIKRGDSVVFFNIREDRARQLTAVVLEKVPDLCFVTAVSYDDRFGLPTLYTKPPVKNTLLDVLEQAGKRVFTIAETEKYAHITYFFSGGQEAQRSRETRVLVPSHGLRTYETDPCMSAPEITARVVESLTQDPHDFYLINYANADMVGHSGTMSATVRAIECLDTQLAVLYQLVVRDLHGVLLVTGDHGNAEQMWDVDYNQPKTGHTTNPVPFFLLCDGDFCAPFSQNCRATYMRLLPMSCLL